jgi:hypothetical protein
MALPPHLADLESRLASRVDDALSNYRRAVEKRLRDAVEQLATTSQELPPPTLHGLLEGLELSKLDLGPRREAAHETLGKLLGSTLALDGARTQAEALDALLDGTAVWSDRVALLLVRDDELVAWGERGFTSGGFVGQQIVGELRDLLVTRSGCRAFDAGEAATITGALDVAAGGPAVVVPLVLRDRVAAEIWADRRQGEPDLAALQLLATAAGQRLELQALSDRGYTPALYLEGAAPGEPLSLWSVAPPPTVDETVEPEVEAEPAPPPPEPELVEPIAEALPEVVEETAEPSAESVEEAAAEAWEPVAEPAVGFDLAPVVEPTMPPEAEAPPPTVDEAPEVAAEAEPEVETPAEPLPDFDYAPEPTVEEVPEVAVEAEPELEPEPEPVPEEPETTADLHSTVRLEVPPEFAAPRPPEETTAPLPVAAIEPTDGATATHEIPAPIEPPPGAEEIDITEDATLLTGAQASAVEPEAPVEPPPPPLQPAPPPAVEEDPMDRTASRGGRSTQVAPPPNIDGPGLAFMSGSGSRALSDSPAHEEAKRLARLLISEIKLYNEEQVLEGRRNRDLYHRLREDIDRSRQIFDERVDPAVRADNDFFQQELVRSLAGGDPRALGI